MKYKEINVQFKYCENNRFYRTLLVHENINLQNLGCAITTAINAEYEHNFYFETKDKAYCPACFMENAMPRDVLMDNYTLEALGNEFEYLYDTGDGWDFVCTVTDSNEVFDPEIECMLIDGKGMGVWEDNINTLHAYFAGLLNHPICEEDEEEGYFPPWNMEIEAYSDFDTKYNLEEEIEDFYERYIIDLDMYKEHLEMYDSDDYCIKDVEDEENIELDSVQNEFNLIDEIMAYLYDACYDKVKTLIKQDDFTKSVYERLKLTCKPKEAKIKILKEFIYEQLRSTNSHEEFSETKYKKALKKLI